MPTKKEVAAEILRRRQLRDRCQDDLLAFIEYTHPNWETAPHHRLLCDWLMKLEREEITCLAVFAPPRHGKSEVVSRRFPAWCMGRNPHWQMICAQANGQLAQDMGANVRDIVNSNEFKEVFPDVVLKEDAKAAGRWAVVHPRAGGEGLYYATGIGGKIIGRGANLLNIDDPLDAEGAASPRQRDIAAQFYFGDGIQRLMSPGLQLFTTTRRHEDDLAGRILPPQSEWVETDDPRVFKAVAINEDYAEPEVWWVINLQAISNEGTDREEALWPGIEKPRFPLDRLRKIRARLLKQGHAREWYAQYQQQITPEEGSFCKRSWFEERYEGEKPDLWVYATSDLAVTEEVVGRDPDYTEHGIFGLEGLQMEFDDKGQVVVTADSIYVLDWWAGRTTPDKWIEELLRLFKKWNVNTWFGTKGVIRNAIEGYLQREMQNNRCYTRIEWLSDVKDKAAKGRPLQGMASQGRILFPKKIWAERVINNICTFPFAKHDDSFDTAANIVRALGELPSAFWGAPFKKKTNKTDCYETWETKPQHNWKSA